MHCIPASRPLSVAPALPLCAEDSKPRCVKHTGSCIVSAERQLKQHACLKRRFNIETASLAAGWAQELMGHSHTPETLEYGISSFVFRASRAFHPQRLWTNVLEEGHLPAVTRSKGFFWIASHPDFAWEWATAGVQIGLLAC